MAMHMKMNYYHSTNPATRGENLRHADLRVCWGLCYACVLRSEQCGGAGFVTDGFVLFCFFDFFIGRTFKPSLKLFSVKFQ